MPREGTTDDLAGGGRSQLVRHGRYRIGCSSWTSDAWWGRVYPERLADGERLAWYARIWDTVEVDASYYRDPGPYLTRRWAATTPAEFTFALKFPRDLLDPKRPVDREKTAAFASAVRLLGPKLGPLLLQFPPGFTPDRGLRFLEELIAELPSGLRYAVELRAAGWYTGADGAKLLAVLRERGIVLAWSYLTYLDVPPVRTGDFVYLRFIGDHTTVPAAEHGTVRVDRSPQVALWAQRAAAEKEADGIDTFVFFNNHFAGFAPESVNDFRREVGLPPLEYGLPGGRPTTLD